MIKKLLLICEILKLESMLAFNYKGDYVDFGEGGGYNLSGWTHPFRRYVNYTEAIIGTTGGPSEATIKDCSYSWDVAALAKATLKELRELEMAVKQTYNMYREFYEKYNNPKNVCEFIKAIGES